MSRHSFGVWMVLLFFGQALVCWPSVARAQQEDLADFLFFMERLPPEGKVFPMPGGSAAPYRLIKVEEDSVTIAPVLPDGSLGKEVVIKKK